MRKIKGGISGVVRKALSELFFAEGQNFRDSGILVKALDGTIFGPVFARMGALVGDDLALTQILRTKGHGGNSNCPVCKNVVRVSSGLAESDATGYLVTHAESDITKFDEHTDQTLWQALDRVLATPRPQAAALEVALGLHRDEHCLVADNRLREYYGPISTLMFDFSHVFLINGLVQFEMGAFLLAAKPFRITYPALNRYFAAWTWPKHEHNPPVHLFNDAHDGHPGEFKAGSSECLSMYGVFRKFVADFVPANVLVEERKSLFSLFACLDAWKAYQASRLLEPARWEREICFHHEQFKQTYGVELVKPKHHRALHLVSMLRRHGYLQATLVHERRHKEFKEFAREIKVDAGFELAATKLVLNHHSLKLQDETLFLTGTAILKPSPVPSQFVSILPAADSWEHGAGIKVRGLSSCVGDVIVLQGAQLSIAILKAALVRVHGAERRPLLLVQHCTHVQGMIWRPGGLDLAEANTLRGPCTWCSKDGTDICVVMPGDCMWDARCGR